MPLYNPRVISVQSDADPKLTGDVQLVSGTSISLDQSGQAITINASGSTDIAQTEVDFGTTPVSDATFTVASVGVTTASQIIAQVAWKAPTGKEIDEIEMDNLEIRCQPGTDQFFMFINTADGSYLADKFIIQYLVG